MQPYIRPILIGVAVAILLQIVFGFLLGQGWIATFFAISAGVTTAYLLSNLAGNRKVAAASDAAKAEALKLQPPAGQSLLVVWREGFVAKLAGLNLAVDGRAFTQLTSPKFAAIAVSPGRHTLSGAFGGFAGAQSKAAAFDFDAAEGAVTAVRINAQMGMVQGAVKFTPEPDLTAVRVKLASMPMAAAEAAAT